MNIERALVTKIVTTGQLEDALSKGVRADLLVDGEVRDLFEYVLDHARRYKTPPSMAAVRHDRPNFEFEPVQEPLDWLIDRFRILAKRRYANEMIFELAAMTKDTEKADKIDVHFLEVARKLATLVPSSEIMLWKEGMRQRVDDYERDVREGRRPGIPFGFPSLDEWTGGIQDHEYVTIAGFSGLGKSTLLMVLAFNIWLAGYTPLYISLEMEKKAIARKFDAMYANLDYWKLKHLELPDETVKSWREKAEDVLGKPGEIPIIDSIRNCTPDDIFAEIIRHKPDIVFVDYVSLMRSSRPSSRGMSVWQSLTEITQDMKQVARTLHTPIVAAAQTNRSGGKDGAELDNIGYSISVVQDSDIVIGLYADDEMREQRIMEIRLNKNRDGRIAKFRAVWDHETMTFRQRDLFDEYKRQRS